MLDLGRRHIPSRGSYIRDWRSYSMGQTVTLRFGVAVLREAWNIANNLFIAYFVRYDRQNLLSRLS